MIHADGNKILYFQNSILYKINDSWIKYDNENKIIGFIIMSEKT